MRLATPPAMTQSAGAGQPDGAGEAAVITQPSVAAEPAIASLPAKPSHSAKPSASASPSHSASPTVSAGPAWPSGTVYYLALGDSLAAGYQPDGTTGQGYADQLDAQLRAHGRDATLENYGCGGETTETMMQGGTCSYSDGSSQVQAAVAFLQAHPGQVPLITINIGGNDVNDCTGEATTSSADSCYESVDTSLSKNLTTMLGELRTADPSAVIAGLNYYVPELASWLDGSSGQALAAAQLSATKVMNAAMDSDYEAAGGRYADAFTAFSSDDLTGMTTLSGHGSVPVDVAAVCNWTWECTSYADEHANQAGYGVIATSIFDVLPSSFT
jgi:lysophospholipase L1-like esterase